MTFSLWQNALKSWIKTLELKKCSAILCKDVADHLHYLDIIAAGFLEAEKRLL